MKILVTGGTGFLGGATALRLKALGHEVKILGRNPVAGQKIAAQGVAFLKVDLSNKPEVIASCKDIDQVVHCAALASPWGKYEQFYTANVLGTENLIAGCLNQNVKRIINISSPSIYFNYQHR